MGKRLTDNLNSLYIEAANKLRPKNDKTIIIAYVESYDDIAFWRSILADFENDRCSFRVMLPSQKNLVKGKKSVLMNKLGPRVGKNMIACIDSDYDYVLQQATATSRYINSSPYVFQTYVYAIENYQCYAGCLHDACVQATMNDRFVVDFNQFFTLYSQIIYPLYVWSIFFYRNNDLNTFPLTKMSAFTSLDHIDTRHLEKALVALDKRVRNKLRALESEHATHLPKVENLKQELTTLGVTPENTYLFVQGHHLKDNVTLKLLVPICNSLRREREAEIQSLAKHNTQYRNELAGYENRQLNIEVVLNRHTGFKSCPIYENLRDKLQNFVNTL